jgi:hypothetical protein
MVLRKIQVCSRFPLVNIAAYKPHSIFRDTWLQQETFCFWRGGTLYFPL